MPILIFLGRRLAVTAGVLLGVSFAIFSLLTLAPGSTLASLLGGHRPTPALVHALTTQYHLNDPFLVQYWHWLGRTLHGDLGHSLDGQSVTSVLGQRLPVTLELVGLALLAVVVVGVPLGFVAGVRSGGWLDRGVSTVTVIGMSSPVFAVGILLGYIFGVELGWLPVFGGGTGFSDRLTHLVLPVATLAIGVTALVVRQTRAAVLNVMEQDYITFARARGLPSGRIIVRYALRNSSLPIVTTAGLVAIGAVSGSVLVETVFSIPGLGSGLTQAIQTKDVTTAQGTALLIAVAVVLINVLVDLVVLVLDPRTRHTVEA